MTAIYLPPSPTAGQVYVATNGVSYTWMGGYWSSEVAILNGQAVPYYEGGDSTTWSTASQVNSTDSPVLDGGTA